MQVPERERVEALPRHLVKQFVPEIHAPHFGNIRLRRIAAIGIGGGSAVERNVEFDSSLRDVRRVVGIAGLADRVEADGFRDIEAAVHCAIGVGAQDGDGDPAALFRAADGVRLRRRGIQRGDVQRLGKRVRFGGVAGDGEAEGTCEGVEVAEAAVRRGPFRSKGASNFGGGERDLRRLAVVEDGLRAQGGADDQSRQEKKRGDS